MASDPFHDMLKDMLGVAGHIVWEIGLVLVPIVALLWGGLYFSGIALITWALLPALIWGVRYQFRKRR